MSSGPRPPYNGLPPILRHCTRRPRCLLAFLSGHGVESSGTAWQKKKRAAPLVLLVPPLWPLKLIRREWRHVVCGWGLSPPPLPRPLLAPAPAPAPAPARGSFARCFSVCVGLFLFFSCQKNRRPTCLGEFVFGAPGNCMLVVGGETVALYVRKRPPRCGWSNSANEKIISLGLVDR